MESESLIQIVENCKVGFEKEFGTKATLGSFAPGRVNIIGEHTDYNDGFVFPMAIPLYTVVVGKPNGLDKIQLFTFAEGVDEPKRIEFNVPKGPEERLKPGTPKWANYMKGVIEHFPGELQGFDACIITTVPLGGGLSSSASLEVATCTFLEILTKQTLPLTEKALLCQKAEHTFANMPCGIMDQFIICMGKIDSALLIDCRNLSTETVPLAGGSQEYTFLVVNSNVKHELSGSEYPQRRADCYEAAKIIGVKSLRDATMANLRENRDKMNDRIYQRALHVVSEIERTTKAAEAIKSENMEALGKLMYQSHVSLRDLYGVSCKELDELVDITMKTAGVLGSRMTGGGFGGCIVALVKSSESTAVIAQIEKQYSKTPTCYVFRAVNGSGSIDF